MNLVYSETDQRWHGAWGDVGFSVNAAIVQARKDAGAKWEDSYNWDPDEPGVFPDYSDDHIRGLFASIGTSDWTIDDMRDSLRYVFDTVDARIRSEHDEAAIVSEMATRLQQKVKELQKHAIDPVALAIDVALDREETTEHAYASALTEALALSLTDTAEGVDSIAAQVLEALASDKPIVIIEVMRAQDFIDEQNKDD